MKKNSVIIILCFFCININLLNAQNSKATPTVAKKKSSITQDLNRLELEKIKAIDIGANQKEDSFKNIDTIKKTKDSIVKIIEIDTIKKIVKADSIKIIYPNKISFTDTLKTTKVDSVKINLVKKDLSKDTIKKVSIADTVNVVAPKEISFIDTLKTTKVDSVKINLVKKDLPKDTIEKVSIANIINIVALKEILISDTLKTTKVDSVKINLVKKDLPKDTIEKVSKANTINIVAPKENVFPIKKQDTLIEKTILIDTIQKNDLPNKPNSLDTILKITTPKILKETSAKIDTFNIENHVPKEKLSSKDSTLKASYIKQTAFADSIRNANKNWLDSTLTNLPKSKPVVINNDDPIEIFVSGGGFYAGTNPKMYDRLTIYHTGLVHREFKTKLQGEQVEEKMLSKDELIQLAKYIVDMGYFDFNNLYECKKENYDCITRMKFKPEPVPLSVSVAIGSRRKKIFVSFFAPKIEPNYVDYPKALEKIVESIYNILK